VEVNEIRVTVIGGIIGSDENRLARRKTCPSATLLATNPTVASLGFVLIFQVERQATKSPSQGKTWVILEIYESKLNFPRNDNLDKSNKFYRMFPSSLVVKHDDGGPGCRTEKKYIHFIC